MRIDQVGGLVAPPSLREACRHLEAGRIGAEEMRAAEGVAIRAVLRKQEEIGIPVLSDGGFGGIDPIHPQIAEDDQWRKFERIVETVRDVWR